MRYCEIIEPNDELDSPISETGSKPPLNLKQWQARAARQKKADARIQRIKAEATAKETEIRQTAMETTSDEIEPCVARFIESPKP
jgi:hypothetical protein